MVYRVMGTSHYSVLEQAIDKAVEAVTQASTAPCNELVCVTGNDVFVLRRLRKYRPSVKNNRKSVCARTRVSTIYSADGCNRNNSR